jgi:Zn-dependent metalloprotease
MSHRAYTCVCFALPRKLVQHLASKSEGGQRDKLLRQIDQSASMRGQRTGSPAAPAKPGKHPLHRQVFDARGKESLPGRLLRDEDDPPVGDAVADVAYENIGVTMKFYQQVLGRQAMDGKGGMVDATVHYGEDFNNAMWDGRRLVIGDGDGVRVLGLAQSLGLIAHEYSHGVMQHIVRGNLGAVRVAGHPPIRLAGEAGALNESFADVFATMVKQWHAKQTVEEADWLIGEDVLAPEEGKAVRSLKDPGNTRVTWAQDGQIRHYRHYRTTDEPHTASGIPNHAFYLTAKALGGQSWKTLGDIWFEAYDRLYSRATFLDAAHSLMDVAGTQQRNGKSAREAIKAAWKKVGVLA